MTTPAAVSAVDQAGCHNVARLEFDYIERFGEYKRLFYEERVYTNVQELQYAGAIAQVLKDRGVGPGDRVLTMIPNMPELTASYQAIWSLGAVVLPMMPQWTAPEIAHVLANSEAKAAITIPLLAPKVAAASQGIDTLAQRLTFGPTELPGFENILPQIAAVGGRVEEPVDRSPSDLAMLLYTSGTTAKPKGVMLTHGNTIEGFRCAFALNHDLPRGTSVLMLPLTHVYGVLMLQLGNGWGCSAVLLPQFDPIKAFQAVERYRAIYMPVVPTMLVYLLNHPERERYDTSSLQRIVNGGAALPEHLRVAFESVFHCRVEQGYGLSETVAVGTGYSGEMAYRPFSAGVVTPGVRISIQNDKNEILPVRAVGEICFQGPNVTAGYWKDPEATKAAFSDGWFHTGDIGYLDEEDHIFITDRKKDLVIKGGENISPREIEEALYSHPAVLEAAVVGMPDPVFGEEICAVIQLKPGAQATEEEIRAHAARFVTKFKVPAKVVFESALPRASTGKISKRDIRAQLARGA